MHTKKTTLSFSQAGPNSVFQAEVWAIKKASELMLEQLEGPLSPAELQWIKEGYEVLFYSDSQAALKSTESCGDQAIACI